MTAKEVFEQYNGDVTREYYQQLSQVGPIGRIAVALFRAQKRSTAAKRYRKGHFRRAAYDVKEWSMSELCKELTQHAESLTFTWGWKQDHNVPFGGESSWVLYVDIPIFGQVSFHSPSRDIGPDYPGEWDKSHFSAERIIHFCDSVLTIRRTLAQ